jgi:hypothetical protein
LVLVNDPSLSRFNWEFKKDILVEGKKFVFVPARRGWEQQVRLILASNMINVSKSMCMCATYLTVHVIVYFVTACVYVWNRKSQAKLPTWGSQAKQHPWEESEVSINSSTSRMEMTRLIYSVL